MFHVEQICTAMLIALAGATYQSRWLRGEIESPGNLVTQISLATLQMQYGSLRYDAQCPTAGVYLSLLTGFYRGPGIGV